MAIRCVKDSYYNYLQVVVVSSLSGRFSMRLCCKGASSCQVVKEERQKEERGEESPVASNLTAAEEEESDASFQA